MDQRENREKWNNKCFLLLCVLLCGLLFLTACDLRPLKDVIDRMPVLGQDARPSEETVTQPQPEEETTEPQPEAESTLPEETTEPEETTLPEEEIRLEDVFVLADTANTSEKYNIPFTVGTKGILFVKSHIAFYAKPSCTQCDHTVVTNYTAKDFIATK